jgi:hypothetical protein
MAQVCSGLIEPRSHGSSLLTYGRAQKPWLKSARVWSSPEAMAQVCSGLVEPKSHGSSLLGSGRAQKPWLKSAQVWLSPEAMAHVYSGLMAQVCSSLVEPRSHGSNLLEAMAQICPDLGAQIWSSPKAMAQVCSSLVEPRSHGSSLLRSGRAQKPWLKSAQVWLSPEAMAPVCSSPEAMSPIQTNIILTTNYSRCVGHKLGAELLSSSSPFLRRSISCSTESSHTCKRCPNETCP